MNLRESIKKILKEDRFKGYKRFLKDNVFTDFPDYIINDMFRESGDLDYSQVQGMTKNQIIDYFLNGEGHKFFDRWGGYRGQKPKVIEIKWSDLTEPLQKFLKNKMSGENPNFPDSREKIVQMMDREPNLGKGENEPVLLKYNNEGKIEDIPGGNHRTYVAFELNNFNPILMKAYVDNDPKPNLQESIKRILKETREEKVKKFIYSKFDKVFDELNLEVDYEENDYVYGKWSDKNKREVFHRNNWGSFWIIECEPYRTLYRYSKSVGLDDEEFEKMLINYLNDKYKEQFLNKKFKSVGDELYCLEDESIWN